MKWLSTGLVAIAGLAILATGCNAVPVEYEACQSEPWPGDAAGDSLDRREVTIVIALSSIVPGGIVGHSGIAVDEQYWDFGPQRVEKHQRLKAFNSPAGPWWDDPDQRWQTNRSFQDVLEDMPTKLKPPGSLVALVRVEVTDKQADTIMAFWEDTYARMRAGDDRYRLAGRQCANMVGWSLEQALRGSGSGNNRLPSDLWMMTPTRLYETLRDSLSHTSGPHQGEPADITLWQLGPDGMARWQRPAIWDALGFPELPRTRLAFERIKHAPHATAK